MPESHPSDGSFALTLSDCRCKYYFVSQQVFMNAGPQLFPINQEPIREMPLQ